MRIIQKYTSSRWCERSELTQTGSNRERSFASHIMDPRRLNLLAQIAGMTLLLSLSAQAQQSRDQLCEIVTQAGMNKDAYGRPVAPADLQSDQAYALPETLKIPIDVQLADRLSALEGRDIEANTTVAVIVVSRDGSVSYNGQDITSSVETLCAPRVQINNSSILNNGAIINRQQMSRQKQVDAIKSSSVRTNLNVQALEVEPTKAVPPQDVEPNKVEQTNSETQEPEIITGSEYREIFYNE